MRLLERTRIESCADRPFCNDPLLHEGNFDARCGMQIACRKLNAFCMSRWRYVIRPLNLGLIGLAIAVALWGFAYKLSLYHPHRNHTARTYVAKMWLGPKGASAAARTPARHCSYPEATLKPIPPFQARAVSASNNGSWPSPDSRSRLEAVFPICSPRPPPSHNDLPRWVFI